MECPSCQSVLREEASVCFNCETVLPSDCESVVAAIRASAEQDQFARAARTGVRQPPDSLANDYDALTYATYKRHNLWWEHPWLRGEMGFREYAGQAFAWWWGWVQFVVVMLVLIFAARFMYAWLT
jgi:hypothetical protein